MTAIAPGAYAHATKHGIVYLTQSANGWTWEIATQQGNLTDACQHHSRSAALQAFNGARGTITKFINRS